MNAVRRHRVFISFHHGDQLWKDKFVAQIGPNIIDESVEDGDIDDARLSTETVRQRIRDQFISDATVTVVLVGPCTWQRKHVDWEIGSSLRDTRLNARCGLVGILLPNHGDFGTNTYRARLMPPRLADNCNGYDPYAHVHKWPRRDFGETVRRWVHRAFERRTGTPPVNSRTQFRHNRSGPCSAGWRE